MIFLDQHAEPADIARTRWRELGPEACIAIALSLAVRGDGQQTIILDLSGLEKIDVEKNRGPAVRPAEPR